MSGVTEILGEDDPMRGKILEALKSNGIPHEVETISMRDPPELKGEHFATATAYITVKFKDQSIKDKNLFMKLIPKNPMHGQMARQMKFMDKESAFFMEFLPTLKELVKGKGISLDFFPKCLYGDEDILVLENLVLDKGFVMLAKEVGQDLPTAKYVLANLADFHAASFAYIQTHGGIEGLKETWPIIVHEALIQENSPMLDGMFEGGMSNCLNIAKSYPVEGGEKAIEELSSLSGSMRKVILGVVKPEAQGKVQVVNHGDCWNNNMLFKKNPETGEVEEHVFVDLQITRLGSPCLDLGYYLYLSVAPEVRRANFEDLIRHYFSRFKETCETLGQKCPITFEELLADYKDKYQLGFFTGLTMLSAIGSMKDMDMDTMPDSQEAMMEVFLKAMRDWIENNPEASSKIANEVVALFKEKEALHKM